MSGETTATEETPDVTPNEQNLRPEEQAALKVAREGLPAVDPQAKPDNRPQKPEGLQDKFWDAEKGEVRVAELAKSYSELETKFSAPKEEPTQEAEEGEDVEVKNGKISKKEAEAEEEGEGNPLTSLITAAASEFDADGAFSEETASGLTEAGIPPEIQAIYLAGIEATRAQQEATVQGYVGGADQYNAMAQWAGRTLSDAELEAFNSALDNPALAENAVTGLYARFQKAHPSEGRKVTPQNGVSDGGDVFKSRDELVHAQSDPRYRTDPVYQREVTEKLARTMKAGTRFN